MVRRIVLIWALALAGPVQAGPEDAVLRVPSHGASATVIFTTQGRSWVLGCAHAYQGAARTKPMAFDVPHPSPGAAKAARPRLLAVDYQADLSLVEIPDGPLPYCAPVAPAGYRPGRRILSVGYDEMKQPPQRRTATLLRNDGQVWWTRERPWHGRSGGGLIDLERGWLIGVCQGYTGPSNHREVQPGAEGMYVSLDAIHRFLARHGRPGAAAPSWQPPMPYATPFPGSPPAWGGVPCPS